MKNLFLICLLTTFSFAHAQVAVNSDGSAPDNSSMLDVKSTNKGFLPPRMTEAQRDAIVNPAAGLTIWCTSVERLQVYDGTGWQTIVSGYIPTLTTNVVFPNYGSATVISNISSEGSSPVSERGVCWSTIANPTFSDSHTSDGSGPGSYNSYPAGLGPVTTYHVRAYATNSIGTAYGNDLTFTTFAFTCGNSISIVHSPGNVAPVLKSVTYETVTNIPGDPSKCWITSNLGANHQATAVNDATEASAGWYWQFNRKQGYKHDGTTRTPNTTWITSISENSDWSEPNDPCALLLGGGWRLPTYTEWLNVDATGNWTSWTGPWNSALKLHAAGNLMAANGSLYGRGTYGTYYSSTQFSDGSAWYLSFYTGVSTMFAQSKTEGFPVRCIK